MVAKCILLLSLYKTYGKLDLLWFLRDTKYCIMQIFGDLVIAFTAIAGMLLLTAKFGGFGGMGQKEVLFMLGYATVVDGIYTLFYISSNVGQISRVIGRGQLDHSMIQPVPLWMQFITEGFSPISGSSILICGIVLTGNALFQLDMTVSIFWIIVFILHILCSCIILVSVIYIVSTMAFYAPVAAEEIAMVVLDMFLSLKCYPLGGLTRFWKVLFCSIIPIGLGAWFPTKGLLDMLQGDKKEGLLSLGFHVAITIVILLIMIVVFKKGMNYYAKYGSPRYSGFGHR